MTIVEFINARLDEEETAAAKVRDADGAPSSGWSYDPENGELDFRRTGRTITLKPKDARAFRAELTHAAHYNPVRILREIAAKRRIVQECERSGGELAEAVLDQVAALYQSHPDYLSWM